MSNNYYDNQNASAPNVVLAHALAGDPVGGKSGIASGGDIQIAGLHSMAPYVERKPMRRKRDGDGTAPLCAAGKCKAYPMKVTGYCYAHSKWMGLLPVEETHDDAG
jgi:hypothetical protein